MSASAAQALELLRKDAQRVDRSELVEGRAFFSWNDAQLASARAAAEASGERERGSAARRGHSSGCGSLRSTTTSNHERALELAFSGPHWGPDTPQSSGMGSYNSAMGTNYGWRARSYGPV